MSNKLLDVKIYHCLGSDIRNPWNNLVEQSNLGSFFHRYEWLKAIEDGIGLKANHIVVTKNGNLVGILPNFIIAVRNTPFKRLSSVSPGFGGPVIVSKDEDEILTLILQTVSRICRKNVISHVLTTLNPGYGRYANHLEKEGYRVSLASSRFVINLNQSCESILFSMDSSKRKHLRRALNQDYIVIDEEITDDNVKKFYKSYREVVRRHEAYSYPLSFFENLKNMAKDRIKIFSVYVEGENMGSVLRFLDEEQSSIHAFFSGIEPANFKYFPAELLIWHVIKWGINNRYKTFDLGATSSDCTNGVFIFKEGFGGQIVPIFTWEKIYSKLVWKLVTAARPIYSSHIKRIIRSSDSLDTENLLVD